MFLLMFEIVVSDFIEQRQTAIMFFHPIIFQMQYVLFKQYYKQ